MILRAFQPGEFDVRWRVEAGTADDNAALRAVLEGLGFRQEDDYQEVRTTWT